MSTTPNDSKVKPKISIVVITLGRRTLYELVKRLLQQEIDYEYEIVLISSSLLESGLLKDKKIKIRYEPRGIGFSHYRNMGVKHSQGEIIVYIDDDEKPISVEWLKNLIAPILNKRTSVATSGYYVPLGEGYLADSISFLGFPGGGCVGFKTMWEVDKENYTHHICTGNLAIMRKLLGDKEFFNENLRYGSEDVELSERLSEKSIKISYVEEATVFHEPRRDLFEFVMWQIRRGKAAYEFTRIGSLKKSHTRNRLKSSIKIVKKSFFTKYFLLVVVFMFIQNLSHLIGYAIQAIEVNLFKND
ncbi:hypothetical protein A3K80_09005 [Candidatus Bathyarchaeota archaeon RBG_13_38_9]|nr:MAG: hypothetical protein A3K80_09005 [Candidatus Bathyarchaeota archaeon RBG_13_38_9]